jgi:hypothetical protein
MTPSYNASGSSLMKLTALGLTTLATSCACACSGPRISEVMARADAYAVAGAVIHGSLAVAAFAVWRTAKVGLPSLLAIALLLAIHPAWTVSSRSGDCGGTKVDTTFWMTVIAGACFALQLWSLRRSRA